MNERTALTGARSGLLAEYGIDAQGTPEALAELRRILADRPVGEALVLIVEQGRKYGLRLFATACFDERVFVRDAARFGMDDIQARRFMQNLVPGPLPSAPS